jgi:hypothetical protein
VPLVQSTDQFASCEAITAEIQANNQQIRQLAKEKGVKAGQNIVAGAAGLLIPVLWFGMDWQGTAGKEANALSQRNQYLGQLALERCRPKN